MSSINRMPGRAVASGLIITLIGLVFLLITPIVGRRSTGQRYERIETVTEPAQQQLNRALASAQEARGFTMEYFHTLAQTAPDGSSTPLEYYGSLVRSFRLQIDGEPGIRVFGGAAARNWREGRECLLLWMTRYGRGYVQRGDVGDQEEFQNANRLFAKGIRNLQEARGSIAAEQSGLRADIYRIGKTETLIAAPLVIVCLILAALAWQNQRRLRLSFERELGVTSRLDTAMRESNHRIKNNLQMIGALLDMQLQEPGDTVQKDAVEAVVQQVRVVAAVHDFLSREMKGAAVQGDAMMQKLTQLSAVSAGLTVQIETDSVILSVKQATALALIANELFLNSAKHGAKSVQVTLSIEGGTVELTVADNGPGFPEGFNLDTHANLGLTLVTSLAAHDLGGVAKFETDCGARVHVRFPAAPHGDVAAKHSGPQSAT